MGADQPDQGTSGALEALLAAAAADGALRAELLADPLGAAARAGYQLAPSEREMLAQAPREQLEAMLAGIASAPVRVAEEPVTLTGSRPDRPVVRGTRPGCVVLAAATGIGVLAGGAYLLSFGARPDVPPPSVSAPATGQQPAPAADGGAEAPADGGDSSAGRGSRGR